MLRSIDASRALRGVVVLICALLALGSLAAAGPETTVSPPVARGAAREAASISRRAEAPPAAWSSARRLLSTDKGSRVFVYPPRERPEHGAPIVVMLHGMCSSPVHACDAWSGESRADRWLVCPTGNVRCGEYNDWKGGGQEKAAAIDDALAAVDAAVDPALIARSRGAVLVGFSRGAFVVRDVVSSRPGRFRALILIGASMTPDAAQLRAAGVERVVMAAGDYDGAGPTMQRAARLLDARGVPARYFSLGPVGHRLPPELGRVLGEALAFIDEGAAAAGQTPASLDPPLEGT